jgi:phage/plasmid primase-like uncharacterized protein
MTREPNPQNPPCPRCGATHVMKNDSKGGRPHWVCRNCQRSFGPTLSTAMDRLCATPYGSGVHTAGGDAPCESEHHRRNHGLRYETIGR